MRLHDRIRHILQGMPDGSAVMLPVERLREWLDAESPSFEPDLTVAEVAEMFGRSPVSVRAWIRDGKLRAYRFQGREYRVPRDAVPELQGKSP